MPGGAPARRGSAADVDWLGLTKLTQSTFANSNGLPDPGNKMTVRELAKLARYVIQTYPEFYKLFGEKEFTWNKIRQQNRNPLLNSLPGEAIPKSLGLLRAYGLIGYAPDRDYKYIEINRYIREHNQDP